VVALEQQVPQGHRALEELAAPVYLQQLVALRSTTPVAAAVPEHPLAARVVMAAEVLVLPITPMELRELHLLAVVVAELHETTPQALKSEVTAAQAL